MNRGPFDAERELPMVDILKNKPHLFDTIQVAFLLTDVHSNVLYANRQARSLFGYKKEEIEGQRLRVLFLEEDMIYLLPNIIYLTLYKEGFEGEALLRRKDGTKVFVHLITSSFKEEGEVFLTFSFQEIQRLKKLEKEKMEAERWASLGRMVEEIAHQIRNPITSIGGYTKRLLKVLPSSPKTLPYLERILGETKRLEIMIHRVEEYIKIPRPIFQKENIQEVVEAALQAISNEVMEKKVSFRLETRGLKGDGNLFVDKGLMVLALSHIFKNSIDAVTLAPSGKKEKEVKIGLLEEGEDIGISVSDRGEGIAKKDLDHIFEPFFSTRPERIGLGLTFAKRVMEEHGGRIEVNSRLKRGTTVTLLFQKDRRRKIRRELLSQEATG
jgi:PAS domain S-box-containing protein